MSCSKAFMVDITHNSEQRHDHAMSERRQNIHGSRSEHAMLSGPPPSMFDVSWAFSLR